MIFLMSLGLPKGGPGVKTSEPELQVFIFAFMSQVPIFCQNAYIPSRYTVGDICKCKQ